MGLTSSWNGFIQWVAHINSALWIGIVWNVLTYHFGEIIEGADAGLYLALGLIGIVTACSCTWIFVRRRQTLEGATTTKKQ